MSQSMFSLFWAVRRMPWKMISHKSACIRLFHTYGLLRSDRAASHRCFVVIPFVTTDPLPENNF